MYKAKVTVSSESHTKQMRCNQHAEFLIVKPGGTYTKRAA